MNLSSFVTELLLGRLNEPLVYGVAVEADVLFSEAEKGGLGVIFTLA